MATLTMETYRGLPVCRLTAGDYTARICPEMGGNLIQFSHGQLGVEAMRTPPDAETLRANPNVYGMPLLFPPNRIVDGTYTFQGRTYTFPINEPARHNFIHGTLSQTSMAIVDKAADVAEASITLQYQATADAPYLAFPHAFTVTLAYVLHTKNGLTQCVTVQNNSAMDMPFGLGFHTAFHAPPNSRVSATIGRECLIEQGRFRPTGAYLDTSPQRDLLLGEGLPPQAGPVSNLYENRGGCVVIQHADPAAQVIYEVDEGYRFFMLWNQNAAQDFFCPEPQTWTVDAPNSPLPHEETGFDAIAPGDGRTLLSRLSIRRI